MFSQQTQLFADLWKSVGLELTIFGVTLACALFLRMLSPAPQGKKVTSAQKKAPPSPSEKSSATSRRERSELPRQVAEEGNNRSRRSPAAVLDEAMECLHDWQSSNGVPASRILSLYSELRHMLRTTGQTMPDLTSKSQHRASDFYMSLVQLVIRTGKSNMLTLIIDDMAAQGVTRTIQFYESAMKQLAVQKQFRVALSVYDKLLEEGLETSTVTYSCLVRFASEVGDLPRAKVFFEKLSSLTTPSIRAYMTILGVHNKRQDWNSAVDTIHDMVNRGVPVDSLALNIALSTGVAADKASEILDLLAEAEAMQPFVPDVVSYNTVIKASAQRSDYGESAKVLKRMLKHNIKPNAITYNTMMDAAIRAGKPDEAWNIFEDMKAQQFQPDKFTCSILVKASAKVIGHAKEDAVERILKLLEDADHCLGASLKHNLYSTVADATAKAELSKALLKVMSQMRARGVTSGPTLQKSMVSALRQQSDPQ